MPECPKSLTPARKLKWKKLVAELEPLGILTQADQDVMMRYAKTFRS
jgi:phage terminase small subunit